MLVILSRNRYLRRKAPGLIVSGTGPTGIEHFPVDYDHQQSIILGDYRYRSSNECWSSLLDIQGRARLGNAGARMGDTSHFPKVWGAWKLTAMIGDFSMYVPCNAAYGVAENLDRLMPFLTTSSP